MVWECNLENNSVFAPKELNTYKKTDNFKKKYAYYMCAKFYDEMTFKMSPKG